MSYIEKFNLERCFQEGATMARVTIEDCLEQVPNRFALIHLAFQRVEQIRSGAPLQIQSKNKEVVVALREIAAGKVDIPGELDLALAEKKLIGKDSLKKGAKALQ
jgi:DNA-directed RNA polymerase omega subunit